MNLYLLRHGSAGQRKMNPVLDRKRPLDKEGKQQCILLGRALNSLKVQFDSVVSSPLKRALQAAVLLRMAVALHRNQSSSVPRFRARVTQKRISIMLLPGRKGADLELWALRKEADYFREVFARDLFVSLD